MSHLVNGSAANHKPTNGFVIAVWDARNNIKCDFMDTADGKVYVVNSK